MVICTQLIPSLSDHERRNSIRIRRMFGAFLREAAALLFVFPILDKIVFGHHIGFWYAFWTFVLAIGVLILGLAFGIGGDDDE
jgi:hypothetical protein